MSHSQRACLVLTTLCLLVPAASAQLEPTWERSTERDIKWYHSTSSGVVVMGTKEQITGLNPEDGATVWSLENLKGLKEGDFKPIWGTRLALLSLRKKVRGKDPVTLVMDVTTGEELWNTSSLEMGESYGSFIIPQINGLMVYGKSTAGKKKKTVYMADLADGELLWKKEEMFKKWDPAEFEQGDRKTIVGNQPPLFDSDSTMILFWNKKSIRKYDFRNGELIWETKDKLKAKKKKLWTKQFEDTPAPAPRLGYAEMELTPTGDQFFAPYQNTLGLFNVHDGSMPWEKTEKLPGIVTDMVLCAEGVVVSTVAPEDNNYNILLIGYQDGQIKWKCPKKEGNIIKKALGDWSDCSNLVLVDNRIIVGADGKLFEISVAGGDQRELDNLGFEGTDDVTGLEQRPDGWLVSGSQNAAWYNHQFEREQSVYFRPPDNIGTGLLLLATALTLNEIGDVYSSGGWTVSVSGDYSAGFEALMVDFEATAEADDHFFILADPPEGEHKGLGLLIVSKTDGSVTGRIPLRTKEPDYQVNRLHRSVTMQTDDKKLACYGY